MKIVVVEDIENQAEWLIAKIRAIEPAFDILHIRTESEFIRRIDEIRQPPPSLVLMDMMLRWTDPAPKMPEVPDGYPGFHRAGLRCVEMLRGNPETADVPVIVTTVLEDVDFMEGELPRSVTLVTKETEPGLLLEEIRMQLGLRTSPRA